MKKAQKTKQTNNKNIADLWKTLYDFKYIKHFYKNKLENTLFTLKTMNIHTCK
jgi:hypothetical protein